MIVGVTIALAALAVIGSNYLSRREDVIIKRYKALKDGKADATRGGEATHAPKEGPK